MGPRDITKRERVEEQLLAQRDLAFKLAKASSLNEALSLTTQAILRAPGCDCGGIYLSNGETGDLELASSAGLSQEFTQAVSPVAAGSPAWNVVNRRNAQYFSVHEEMDLPFGEALIAEGIRSLAVIPISYKEDIVVCFNVGSRRMGTIPAASRVTLELIGTQLGSIVARLRAEQELTKDVERRKQLEEALGARSRSLEEANGMLKALLEGRDKAREELGERVLANADLLIQPYIRKLKKSRLDASQQAWVDIIERSLDEIMSPFLNNTPASIFSPRELEVIALLKEGKSTEEIAELLGMRKDNVRARRQTIRKKLGLTKRGTHLSTYLASLGKLARHRPEKHGVTP